LLRDVAVDSPFFETVHNITEYVQTIEKLMQLVNKGAMTQLSTSMQTTAWIL
jgi:hypothetical protein